MKSLDPIFNALADPTRRAILSRLAHGETNVGTLAEPFDISPPAISRHLRVLEQAGLISNKRQGKQRVCRLNREALAQARDWLDFSRRFWTGSFERLDVHLKKRRKEKRDEPGGRHHPGHNQVVRRARIPRVRRVADA
jgi:DNA-binding transcriptional ArsR family regulator